MSKLSDADGEAAESQSWLDHALRCEYINQAQYEDLDQQYEIISGGLVKMMAQPEKWCGPGNTVREDEADYGV